MPSTAIAAISYFPDQRELDVCFVGSGRVYTYSGVEPEVCRAFRRALSKGAFFNRHIRDHYPYRLKRGGSPRSPGHGRARPARPPAPH